MKESDHNSNVSLPHVSHTQALGRVLDYEILREQFGFTDREFSEDHFVTERAQKSRCLSRSRAPGIGRSDCRWIIPGLRV